MSIDEEPKHHKGLPHSVHDRLHSKKHLVKSIKAQIDEDRKPAERIADFLTGHIGSMTFLSINAYIFLLWIVINIGLIPGLHPFDPFPFGLLTTSLSIEAIFLAVIVLITQNRTSKIDDLREEIALQIDSIAEEEISKMIQLQLMILKKHGVDLSKDKEIKQMIEPTDTEKIQKVLEKEVLN